MSVPMKAGGGGRDSDGDSDGELVDGVVDGVGVLDSVGVGVGEGGDGLGLSVGLSDGDGDGLGVGVGEADGEGLVGGRLLGGGGTARVLGAVGATGTSPGRLVRLRLGGAVGCARAGNAWAGTDRDTRARVTAAAVGVRGRALGGLGGGLAGGDPAAGRGDAAGLAAAGSGPVSR